MMESICAEPSSEQAPDSQLLTYVLIDNTDDRLFVTSLLPNNRLTKSILANTTVRNYRPNLDAFLDTYGPFNRILLNIIDKIKSTYFDTLYKATLRQAVLVCSHLNNEAGTAVLKMLESMGRVQVVIFQDELDMETRIAQMKSLTSSSSLTALDRIEDLRKMVPGHDETSLGWQTIQALDAFHLEVIAELIKASNQDVE